MFKQHTRDHRLPLYSIPEFSLTTTALPTICFKNSAGDVGCDMTSSNKAGKRLATDNQTRLNGVELVRKIGEAVNLTTANSSQELLGIAFIKKRFYFILFSIPATSQTG